MNIRMASVAAGSLGLALATVGAVAVAAPASAAACVTTAQGVGWSAVYTSVTQGGTHLGPASLGAVAQPGATVTVTVKITALPARQTCVDLSLASYRTETPLFSAGSYQTLYDSQSHGGVGIGDTVSLSAIVPQTPGTPGPGCTNTHTLAQDGNGANVPGPYDTTCDGTPSGNGQDVGNANGKACAGCVGNADNKNPPGQLPGPQDNNAGYECDRNQGIAQGNPAHSGCAPSSWQLDLVTGGVLSYLGTPPGGGPTQYYSFGLPTSQQRLLNSVNG